jgi:hypothetical protein
MHAHPLVELPLTEDDYNAWLARHPHGFVINAWKKSTHVPEDLRGMTWHRADCGHIGPFGALRYVTGDTLKACSTNPGALSEWAVTQREPLHYCLSCRDKWRTEQGQ